MFSAARGRAFRAEILKSRALAVALAFTLTVGVAACGDDEPGGPGAGTVGTYSLFSVDGATLPITETTQEDDGMGGTVTVISTISSGSLVLRSNATFTGTYAGSFKYGGDPVESYTITEGGTYSTLSNGQIRFIATTFTLNGQDLSDGLEPDTTTATLSGNTLTAVSTDEVEPGVFETVTIVFKKQ